MVLGFGRLSVLVALAAGGVTILSFVYVLVYLPRVKRIRINVGRAISVSTFLQLLGIP